MSESVGQDLPAQLSGVIEARMGLHFAPNRWPDLMRGVEAAAREFGFGDAESCGRWLCSARLDKRQIAILASHLTIGETYFFREKRSFDILAGQILPRLIARCRQDRRLRIWSAGCCTGEEPYSLAITLARLLPDLGDWDITLLATDINPRFLQRAAAGVFGEWSFRGLSSEIKDRFFAPVAGGQFEVQGAIRQMVTFDTLNLAEDAFPSLLNNTNAMDLILCRNVMIYLAPPQIERLVEKFGRCLCDDASLLVGAAETAFVRSDALRPICYPGIVAFQKNCSLPMAPAGATRRMETPAPPHAVGDPFVEATALYDRGRYADAILTLEPISAGSKAWPEKFALMARACANQGKLAEGLELSERAIEAERMNPSYHYLRGSILLEMADLSGAAACFKRAVFLDLRFVMAHFAMAHLARRQGQTAEMSRHFNNARELLRGHARDKLVPDSDGMTVGRLAEMIDTIMDEGIIV